MARMVKDCPRTSLYDLPDGQGEIFAAADGTLFYSDHVNVIHHGLDTVRQLYNGLVIQQVYEQVEKAYNDGFGLTVRIFDFDWIVSTGGRSGYRYTLKNQNVGLVILLGSQHCDVGYNASHLKIQCSPVFLLSREIKEIQDFMDDLARELMTQVLPVGVAVHLCADVQGYVPPADLDSRITTRARRIMRNSGIQKLEYAFNDVSLVYGKSQSFTFGQQNSLQFAVYDKLKAVKDKGEIALWLPVWAQNDRFDENDTIFRFEVRFHHSVIQQFANGSGFVAHSLYDLREHFTGLWKYALNNFRLDDTKTYINPFWQWLRDDLRFNHMAALSIDYKRLYQSPTAEGLPSDRSIAICFGQLTAIYRKKGMTVSQAYTCLVNSGLFSSLLEMYKKRGLDEMDLLERLDDKMQPRH